MKNVLTQPQKLKALDWYQTAVSILMIVFGIIILFRSTGMGIVLPQILMGGVLLAFGIYRGSFFLRYLKSRSIWNQR